MWVSRVRSNLSKVSGLRTCFSSIYTKFNRCVEVEPIVPAVAATAAAFNSRRSYMQTLFSATPPKPSTQALFSFCSSSNISPNSTNKIQDPRFKWSRNIVSDDDVNAGDSVEDNDNQEDYDDDDDDDTNFKQLDIDDQTVVQDLKTILGILHEFGGSNRSQLKNKLEDCCVKVSHKLVEAVLSRVRNVWEAAFTFFLWAGKQPGYAHSVREYHSMISILGKMRKFDTAWSLIDEMRGGRNRPSLMTPQTLLIMIRRYCAVHDVGRAIHTFYAHKRFNFEIGLEEFQNLLSALCRYKNVKDAEHLLFCNKDVFTFDTKSFNIILNGWCNVIGSTREAERIWNEMTKRGIRHDVVSYASIISCYSKASHLYKVLKLFNRMKETKIDPDRKVYNAVIHALAKGRLVKEAMSMMKTMEEKDIAPNVVTYNSLIKPLCKAQKTDEATQVLDEMVQRGIYPTIQTYHAFLRFLKTGKEVFLLLEKMKTMGCKPSNDTYIMLIRKFCRWRQLDDVFKLWSKMSEDGVSPDRSSYIVLIHGLFLNGKLEDAYKYYLEMKKKELLPEPKIEEMLQAWLAGKKANEFDMTNIEENKLDSCWSGRSMRLDPDPDPKKYDRKIDFRRKPETRRVVREGGFSFWEK